MADHAINSFDGPTHFGGKRLPRPQTQVHAVTKHIDGVSAHKWHHAMLETVIHSMPQASGWFRVPQLIHNIGKRLQTPATKRMMLRGVLSDTSNKLSAAGRAE